MLWFEKLVGFEEKTSEQVREHLFLIGNKICSSVNGKSYQCGILSTPSLAELRCQSEPYIDHGSNICVQEIVGDVRHLHDHPSFHGSVFQVASQFNLLENSPRETPEKGIGYYQFLKTQGPACAVTCGAGTIYRNYFAEVDGQVGQAFDRQINCIKDLGQELGNQNDLLWRVQNGYVFPKDVGLRFINDHMRHADRAKQDELRGYLRIGVQQDTEVTNGQSDNVVTQAYCSALSVAYSHHHSNLWESFARLVLEAAYESTLRVAVLNRQRTGCKHVFLTFLGGGVFGNRIEWIVDAMERAILIAKKSGLVVCIVSYGKSCPEIQRLLT